MFINNKYTDWYYKIINSAKNRLELNGYTEKHHILPKSLGGLDENNLVILSAREHFICHWLLTKMVTGEDRGKMVCALSRMRCTNKQQTRYHTKITNRVYQKIREELSIRLSDINKNRKRKPITETARQNMSKAQKGRIVSNTTRSNMSLAQTGKEMSKATKEKISKTVTGRKFTDEHKKNMSKSQKGRVITEEHRKNIADAKIGKKRKPFSEETKKKMSEARIKVLAEKRLIEKVLK